jgi:hypothetical protein
VRFHVALFGLPASAAVAVLRVGSRVGKALKKASQNVTKCTRL